MPASWRNATPRTLLLPTYNPRIYTNVQRWAGSSYYIIVFSQHALCFTGCFPPGVSGCITKSTRRQCTS